MPSAAFATATACSAVAALSTTPAGKHAAELVIIVSARALATVFFNFLDIFLPPFSHNDI